MDFLRLRGFAIFATAQKGPPFCDGPSLGRNAAKSFAASKAYDISTRQVVSIHTQHPGNRRSAQSRDHADVDGIRFGDLGQGLAAGRAGASDDGVDLELQLSTDRSIIRLTS